MHEYSFAEIRHFHDIFSLYQWDRSGERTRYAFRRMPEFFPHAIIHRDGPVAELAAAPREDIPSMVVRTPLGMLAIDDYIQQGPVDGVVILQQGKIIYERYPRMHPRDNHLLMSVSKVFASAVIAILEDRGLVDTTLGVETYIPEVRGSGWEGVSVRDVLDMASGIDCDEMAPDAYSDPAAKYYRFEASLGLLPPAVDDGVSTYDYTATLGRARTPGEAYDYNSVNTFVLSWIAECVTGKGYSEILTDEIWSKIGAEGDALISSSRSGATAPHGGMVTRLRDLARFGLLYTPSWNVVSAEPLVSERHLAAIQHDGRPQLLANGNRYPKGQLERLAPAVPLFNSYQWDFVMPDGSFFKGGMGGQGLYIAPNADIVVAFNGILGPDGKESALMSIAQQVIERLS